MDTIKRFLILLTLGVFITNELSAQTAEDSVKTVINNLFNAMKASDSVLLISTFSDSAILQTIIKTKAGKIIVKNESVGEFAGFIKTQKANALDERIVFDVVKTDDDLAIAWTPYSFYFNGTFSHCGVNSFQLVRTEKGWKIQYLIDTRRRTGCK
ncbi:MAG TPA: hypothetical protein VK498_00390 [Ferruginibacter sp.]|nr:hypothetical protein [Ferruginibacter sp.]